ncbi:MAG: hypothetical protein WCW44_00865 [archaeon]|jgi:hypothetical protein
MLFNENASTSRGQVSAETLVAVAIVFLLFVIVLAYNSMVADSSNIVAESVKNKSNCLKLSQIISKVYSSGDGASTNFSADFNAQIFASDKTIRVGEESCSFLANTTNKSISANDYTLKNIDWNVLIS